MNHYTQKVPMTRDGILSLLSDAEIAKVSMAETLVSLALGDEYVDLLHLEHGIRRATMTPIKMGSVVPRNAVHEDSWAKIVSLLKHVQVAPFSRVS